MARKGKAKHCTFIWLAGIIFRVSPKVAFFVLLILFATGFVCDELFQFPLYVPFSLLFCSISLAAFFAEREFFFVLDPIGKNDKQLRSVHQIKPIHRIMSGEKVFSGAFYNLRKRQLSIWNFLIPVAVTCFYLVIGLTIFTEKTINITLVIMLIIFSVSVIISIIGYMQYIYLALFVRDLSSVDYETLPSSGLSDAMLNVKSPAHTGWIEQLARFVGVYQNYFFCLGLLYIIGYAAVCFSGAFHVDVSPDNAPMIIGWVFIFLAIVLVFPITYIIEKNWIRDILTKIKNEQISKLEKSTVPKGHDKALMSEIRATRIALLLLSPDYPKQSVPQVGFSIALGSLNFFATTISIVQFLPLAT